MSWIVLALLVMVQPAVEATRTDAPGNYLMGRPDSPVRIEIFSDFECPACRTFYLDTVDPLLDRYSSGNKVAVIFHELPLPVHASSRIASTYAVACAGLGQEQLIKVIRYLYTCQAEWAFDGNIDRVVARVLTPGEMEKVRERLKDQAIQETIDREIALGKKRNVVSTPTFFVTMEGKEQRVVGGLSFPLLNAFIAPSLK